MAIYLSICGFAGQGLRLNRINRAAAVLDAPPSLDVTKVGLNPRYTVMEHSGTHDMYSVSVCTVISWCVVQMEPLGDRILIKPEEEKGVSSLIHCAVSKMLPSIDILFCKTIDLLADQW